MKLCPREVDKLALAQAGALAQRRLARGVALNHPEAVALISAVVLELIVRARASGSRDGRSFAPHFAMF